MSQQQYTTICFTGPRPAELFGYSFPEKYLPIARKLQEILIPFVENGTKRFISGGAQGFDQLAFWVVNEIRAKRSHPELENVIYLPYNSQPNMWKTDGLFGQKEFNRARSRATEVQVINPNPNNRFQAIEYLYKRNHMMVDNSDLVIALLAGRSLCWSNERGGTSECMRYAVDKKDKPVLAIFHRSSEDVEVRWVNKPPKDS